MFLLLESGMGGCQTEGASVYPLYICTPPICSDAPCISKCTHTSVCSHAPMCVSRGYLHMIWRHLNTSYVWGLRGHQYIFQAFWCLSVHPLFLSLWVASYWTGYFWMSVTLHAFVPFFVISLCFMSLLPWLTTMLPVTMVSSGMSSLSLFTMVPSLVGLPATLGQCDVVLPPPLTLICPGSVSSLVSVSQQQPPSPMPLQAYANYAMGSLQVGFFFRVEPPII